MISQSSKSGILKNSNYLFFFSGRIISQLGDQIYTFAISWYILDLTRSSLQMTVPLLLTTIIASVVSLLGGTFADRINRKKILVRTDIVQGTILIAMAVMAIFGSLQVWTIYVFTGLLAFCAALFSPAASAIIPDIVLPDELQKAMSANQFTISLCTMAGMLCGSIVYQIFGITTVLIFNAISFFISAVLESRIKVPVMPFKKNSFKLKENIHKTLSEFTQGYKKVRSNIPVFRFLWVSSAFNIIALPVGMVFIPYFFNVILQSTAIEFAIPQACTWLGMIVSTVIVTLLMRKYTLPQLIWRSLLILAVCIFAGTPIVLGFSQGYLNTVQICFIWTAVNLIVGFSVNTFIIPVYVFFQEQSKDEFRGRFWGIENSMRTLALTCGYLLAGALAQNFNLLFLFAAYAVLTVAIAIWAKTVMPYDKKSSAPMKAIK